MFLVVYSSIFNSVEVVSISDFCGLTQSASSKSLSPSDLSEVASLIREWAQSNKKNIDSSSYHDIIERCIVIRLFAALRLRSTDSSTSYAIKYLLCLCLSPTLFPNLIQAAQCKWTVDSQEPPRSAPAQPTSSLLSMSIINRTSVKRTVCDQVVPYSQLMEN